MPTITFNQKYEPLFRNDPNIFFVFLYSGRAAGKSFAISTYLATRLLNEKGNLVFCRQYMSNVAASIIPEFLDKIELMGIRRFLKVNKDSITCTFNGNTLWFKGLETAEGTAEASMKGIPKLACVVIDEMQEVKEQNFDRLIGTVRDKDLNLKVICALNPTSQSSWIYQRFFKELPMNFSGVVDNRLYIYSSYLENLKYLSSTSIHEIENIKNTNLLKYNNQYLGHWLTTNKNALWTQELLNIAKDFKEAPDHIESKYAIGVDIAVSVNENSDETAITLIEKHDDQFYILEVLHGKWQPLEWATKIKDLRSKYRNAHISIEKNQGGNLIEDTLRHVGITSNFKLVMATKSKILRAQDILCLYEQGRVHHTKHFLQLENEMLTYSGDPKEKSPNCLDSMVYALKDLSQGSNSQSMYIS